MSFTVIDLTIPCNYIVVIIVRPAFRTVMFVFNFYPSIVIVKTFRIYVPYILISQCMATVTLDVIKIFFNYHNYLILVITYVVSV